MGPATLARRARHLLVVVALLAVGIASPASAADEVAADLPTPLDAMAAFRTPTWVDDVNYVRALGGLAPVYEAPTWSLQAGAHSAYMAANAEFGHEQRPEGALHTPGGAFAGLHGNLARGHGHRFHATLDWLASAPHAFWLLNPAAQTMGYGEAASTDRFGWYATLQVNDGTTPLHDGETHVWPANGAVVPFVRTPVLAYAEGCDATRVGGVSVYVRSPVEGAVDDAVMTVDGVEVAACTFPLNHLFTVVMALEPTPHGAQVSVDFLGPGAPPSTTFTTIPAPRIAGATGSGPVQVAADRVAQLTHSLVVEGTDLDLVGSVRIEDGPTLDIMESSPTRLRVDLGEALAGGATTVHLQLLSWPGGPVTDVIVVALEEPRPVASSPSSDSADSADCADGPARRAHTSWRRWVCPA